MLCIRQISEAFTVQVMSEALGFFSPPSDSVSIDEALNALDEDARKRVMGLFTTSLQQAAIVNIGRPETEHHYFKWVLHLVKDPRGVCFIPDLPSRTVTSPQ